MYLWDRPYLILVGRASVNWSPEVTELNVRTTLAPQVALVGGDGRSRSDNPRLDPKIRAISSLTGRWYIFVIVGT